MAFKRCLIGTKGPKVCQENIPHTITPQPAAWTIETRQDGSMLSCSLHQILTLHLNVAAEIETHQTRQHFSNLLLSNFGDPVWIVASVSCSYLTGAAPGVVFCCWSPSASGFDVLCVQRWYSAYLGCNEWLFEIMVDQQFFSNYFILITLGYLVKSSEAFSLSNRYKLGNCCFKIPWLFRVFYARMNPECDDWVRVMYGYLNQTKT